MFFYYGVKSFLGDQRKVDMLFSRKLVFNLNFELLYAYYNPNFSFIIAQLESLNSVVMLNRATNAISTRITDYFFPNNN